MLEQAMHWLIDIDPQVKEGWILLLGNSLPLLSLRFLSFKTKELGSIMPKIFKWKTSVISSELPL